MNNRIASGLICPHQFYACCSPTLQLVLFYDVPPLTIVLQQVYIHGQWLGKTSRMYFHLMAKRWSRWCNIFSPFFSFPENASLGISFLLDITVPTAFVLQPHKWLKIFGLENHLSMYRQWPFPFILSHNLSTKLKAMLCSEVVGCARYICPGCRHCCFLPHKVQTFLFHICGAFLWYKHVRMYTLEMGILPCR